MLSDRQKEQYCRQIMLPEMGEEGQEKLMSSSVLLCGVGGLGSPCALYLTAMGIGHLGLLDGDVVSLSNLNRQILYTPDDLGRKKAEAAAARLVQLNPDIKLDVYTEFLTEENADRLISGYDIIIDCLDNFGARLILNDACLRQNIPFVHAGVFHLSGQTMTVIPGKSPCLRCLFPSGDQSKPNPARKGIIGATAGVLGCMEVTEVYKYLTGLPVNDGGVSFYDGRMLTMQHLEIQPRQDCICQKK